MNRIRKQKVLRYALSALALSILLAVYMIVTVEGEERLPKFAMMRLEDIGPGGQYGSLEQLGKLRAVLEYLQDEKAAYHMAIIPKWIDIPKDGPRYDVRLDDPDNPYAAAFRLVLHEAVDGGATLGIHGYTHQVGDVRREDGHHESGIGNEFNVSGLNETMTAGFAERRLKEGLAIFANIGLKPQFWEAPHYHTSPEQDRVFRSYFGLNYQADVQTNRNAAAAQYVNGRNNGYGAPTLGAVYVPTPLDYIPSNKDEKLILDRMGKSGMVTSFFFHPFLEFKYLEKVTDAAGEPVLRDGIPLYRYAGSGKSLLHKLVTGLKGKGYVFYSIQDYVPFTPAQSVKLSAVSASAAQEKGYPLLGDANGDGQLDVIGLEAQTGSIFVTEGRFRGLRNEEAPAPAQWGRIDSYAKGSAAAVSGRDEAGPCSIWTANAGGRLERYTSDGRRFVKSGSWRIEAKEWSRLYALRQPNGDMIVAGLSHDRMELYGWRIREGEARPLKPYKFRNAVRGGLQTRQDGTIYIARSRASSGVLLRPDAEEWSFGRTDSGLPNEPGLLKFGDYNGDGREDAIRFDPATMRYTVYLRTGDGEWRQLSTFGPWGQPGSDAELVVADFDGNGKSDLGLMNRKDGYLDTALSFVHVK